MAKLLINSDKKAANDTNIVPINVIDLAVNKTANHSTITTRNYWFTYISVNTNIINTIIKPNNILGYISAIYSVYYFIKIS